MIEELKKFDENMKVVVYTGDRFDMDEANDVDDYDGHVEIRSL